MLPKGPEGNDLGRLYAMGQVGIEMVVPIAVGIAVDYWIGWGPWLAIVGTIVGFTGGMFHLIHLANKFDKKDADKDSSEPKTDAK